MMDLRWLMLKVRHEHPRRLLLNGFTSLQRRCARWLRRRRWNHPAALTPSASVFTGSSPRNAQAIWRGASSKAGSPHFAARWPAAFARARRHAAAVADGRFDLLGSGEMRLRSEDGHLRWHDDFKAGYSFPAQCLYLDVPICLAHDGPDIKVPWELSRFQQVFDLIWAGGDEAPAVFLAHWHDWMAANPFARGVNWACTMDVALRAISWTAALAAWGEGWDAGTRSQLAAALAAHGHFIRENLEWTD